METDRTGPPGPGEGKPIPEPGPEAESPEPGEGPALESAPTEAPPPPLPAGMSAVDLVEALLFASAAPLSLERLAGATGFPAGRARELLQELERRLDEQGRPYQLQQVGRGWRLLTRPSFHPFLLRLEGIRQREALSLAALETLAVVAWRQPIIRAEIEDIRGVQAGPMLRALLERRLIRVVGRAQVPGRPLLYGTSPAFLDAFGLKDLKDLPTLKELKEERPPS